MLARSADRRRRTGALLIVAGLACGAGAVATWAAPGARAAELFSYDLQASARGVSMFGSFGGNGQATGFPEATATLANGPVGYGLASMAWPGPLAGNPGQLLNVLQPGCAVTGPAQIPSPNPVCPAPDAATQARYPLKAEARTGQDPPTTTNEDVPGTSMTATATAEEVSADAAVAGLGGEPGTVGQVFARSVVQYQAEAATAEAHSQVDNIDIGGVVAIESVRSTATTSTDGSAGSGDGTTTITGLSIAGNAVDLGPDGLVAGDQAIPVHEVVGEVSRQALSHMGLQIVIGPPVEEIDGASATVTAGSVVITWDTPDGLYGIVLGGAQASVTGAPDTGFDLGTIDPVILGGDPGGFSAGAPAGPAASGGNVGGGAPAPSPAEPARSDPVAIDTTPAFDWSATPIRPSTALLAVLAAALVAVGLRQLGLVSLAESAAVAACPLEDRG